MAPWRLCPHVVVEVGLDRFSDLWGYAGRATYACQAQSETPNQEGLHCARGGWVSEPGVNHQPATTSKPRRYSERGSHLFKKGQDEISTMGGARYRVNCLPGPRDSFKLDTVYLAPEATEGTGGVFSLTLSSNFPYPVQKKKLAKKT